MPAFPRAVFRNSAVAKLRAGLLWLCLLVLSNSGLQAAEGARGLPLIRSFPLEEIGNSARAAQLSFDNHGRVGLISDGAISLLNDTVWTEVSEPRSGSKVSIVAMVADTDGNQYFSGLGSWGQLVGTPSGRLAPRSLVDAQAPGWSRTSSFRKIVLSPEGQYFCSWNGIVFRPSGTDQVKYLDVHGVTSVFKVRGKVHAATVRNELVALDGPTGSFSLVKTAQLPARAILAAQLGDGRALLAVEGGAMMVFDGTTAVPWTGLVRNGLGGAVSAMLTLPEGQVAVAITGMGLFLLSDEGMLNMALRIPQFHRITELAAREPGVLWVLTEDAVEKVLYGSPLTMFGQRVGLPISWPLLLKVKGRIVASSEGRLYEAIPGEAATPSRWELMKAQHPEGAWAATVVGETLLVGNHVGLYRLNEQGALAAILEDIDISFLETTPSGLCYAIGKSQIAVLRLENGRLRECAPRIVSAGSPSVVQLVRESIWMEFGADKVARVELRDGLLDLKVFRDARWAGASWVNVGCVGDLAVLCAGQAPRLYYDERTRAFVEQPRLDRVFARSPHEIVRVQTDAAGTLWAAHRNGVVVFTPRGEDYEMDASTFDNLSDLFPRVSVLGGNDVWISGPRSLFHVERHASAFGASQSPVVVSVSDSGGGPLPGAPHPRYHFDDANLRVSVFSGTYAWLKPPRFRYRLNPERDWEQLSSGSSLTLSGLREGKYDLEIQSLDARSDAAKGAHYEFEILPPWYRTREAVFLYGACALLAVIGLVWWTSAQARHRNLVLERQVRQRTSELELAMEKLNEETRTAATLAERNRLAGEIHDSLQQGLCGAILQLDATIEHPSSQGMLRERLATVRNMISYARHEVQNAVWDLESPILIGTDLATALHNLTALLNPGTVAIELSVTGASVPLAPQIQHNLLRITQEAVTNAIKHAEAHRILIGLTWLEGSVALSVGDDGKGFEPGPAMQGKGGHFGLRGLQTRARKIRGELHIESTPGKGCLIRLTIPLDEHSTLPSNET